MLVVAYLTLEQFSRGYSAFLAAFNGRDLSTAFDLLAPDCEFRPTEELLEAPAMVGREEIVSYFEQVLTEVLADWRVENVRCLQATEDLFLALDRGRGSGRSSGAPVELAFSTVLRLREADSRVLSFRQFANWEQGLEAAGLDPAVAAEVRRSERSGGT